MRSDHPAPSGGNVSNTAHGNVGIQAGHVSGGTFHVSLASGATASAALPEQLAVLREDLSREHSAGRIDAETHEAASEEIDTADKGIAEATPEGRKRSLLALKRLLGLLGDLASLATKVASMITAVKGLS